ncbi:hypothetical protein STEG23_018038, partial [Scotinomys teguina]
MGLKSEPEHSKKNQKRPASEQSQLTVRTHSNQLVQILYSRMVASNVRSQGTLSPDLSIFFSVGRVQSTLKTDCQRESSHTDVMTRLKLEVVT